MAHMSDESARHGWRWPWQRQKPAELRERKTHVSGVSLLLMVAQSAALALVVGHMEISWLFGDQLVMRVIGIVSLFILVVTVIAADTCSIKTMARIPILKRNHAGAMLWEHTSFVAFVVTVEAATFGLCLFILEQNAAALLSTQPLLSGSIALTIGLLVMRVVLVAWTYIQSQIIAQPLSPQWETGLEQGVKLIGGHAMSLLQQLQLTNMDVGAVFEAFAAVTRPAPRRPRRWNKGAIARDQEYQRQLDAQRDEVIKALRQLSEEEVERDAGQVQALSQVQDHMMFQLAELRSLIESGAKPTGSRGAKRPQSRREGDEKWLEELGILAAKAPAKLDDEGQDTGQKERGLWIRSTDIGQLVEGPIAPETLRDLVKLVGGNRKDGTAYIVRFDRIMTELAQRNWLHEEARLYWESRAHSRQNEPAVLSRTRGTEADVEPDGDDYSAAERLRVVPLRQRA